MTQPSYLFGTIHVICPADYLWTTKMIAALNESKKVCFEMDLDDPNVMMQVATAMMDKNGKNLKDYFTAEQYDKLARYVKDSLGSDITMFQQFKPVALETLMEGKTAGCDNPVSYEEKIMATAKQGNKEVLGLETPQEQIAVLETIPVDSVIKDVMDVVNNKQQDAGDYDKMISAYKNQDLPALYAILKDSKEMGGNDMKNFLDERNKKWIDRMADKMEQSSVFFAVGAGHLWGTNGVINLLRKAGYKVEPIL